MITREQTIALKAGHTVWHVDAKTLDIQMGKVSKDAVFITKGWIVHVYLLDNDGNSVGGSFIYHRIGWAHCGVYWFLSRESAEEFVAERKKEMANKVYVIVVSLPNGFYNVVGAFTNQNDALEDVGKRNSLGKKCYVEEVELDVKFECNWLVNVEMGKWHFRCSPTTDEPHDWLFYGIHASVIIYTDNASRAIEIARKNLAKIVEEG